MKHLDYFEIIKKQLEEQLTVQNEIEEAAQYCAQSIRNDRLVHVFGCGHSQMFAMEVFYRAGGIVPVNALLIPHLALFPKAKLSTYQERVEGFANKYLQLEDIDSKDTMIVASVSGRNAAVIDMALEAKNEGMNVIALTSIKFSDGVTSRHSSGKLLKDVADVIIDIKCDLGDAALSIEGMDNKFSGTSTVLGMTVMESLMARIIEINNEKGFDTPVYVSSNLDKGDNINAKYIEEYNRMISCL